MYVNQLTESLSSNPKKFWSFVKSRTGTSSVPSCIEYNGIKGYCPADKAEIFNKFFHSVFSRPVEEFSPPSNMSSSHVISDVICTEVDVAKVLAELETNKSHRPDNIPPRILKECAKELAPFLAKLFNISDASQIQLNKKKCRVLHVTRQTHPLNQDYSLDSKKLEVVNYHTSTISQKSLSLKHYHGITTSTPSVPKLDV